MTTTKNYGSGSEAQPTVHTPRPWEAVRSLTCGHLRAAHNYQTEAKLEWTDDDLRLINALPELLEACRVVLAAIEQANLGGEVLWINRGSPVHESASERLADVIEQATGERCK